MQKHKTKSWRFGLVVCLIMFASPAWAVFQLPSYETLQLPNGLKIYVMERHDVPVVSVVAAVQAGSVEDEGTEGLAYVTSEAMLLGTKNLPHRELDRVLEYHGVDLAVNTAADAVFFNASFETKYRQKILAVLADVLQHPIFPSDDFKSLKDRLSHELVQAKDSPRDVIGAYFNRFLFGNHPYGSPVHGSEASLAAMTLDQVKAFHASHYTPDHTGLTIVGDVSAAEIQKICEDLFKDWKKSTQPRRPLPPLPQLESGTKVLLVNKPDATESTYYFGGLGVPRNQENLNHLELINANLGGKFTSWLVRELRFKAGLTYGAASRFRTFKEGGSFVISSFTKNDTTIQILDKTLEVYQRLWNPGISKEDLSSSQSYLKGQFPPEYETSTELAKFLSEVFIYGVSRNSVDHFEADVDRLRLDQVKPLVQKYFPKDAMRLVVIGKGDAIREQLKKYGPVQEVLLKDNGFGAGKSVSKR